MTRLFLSTDFIAEPVSESIAVVLTSIESKTRF